MWLGERARGKWGRGSGGGWWKARGSDGGRDAEGMHMRHSWRLEEWEESDCESKNGRRREEVAGARARERSEGVHGARR